MRVKRKMKKKMKKKKEKKAKNRTNKMKIWKMGAQNCIAKHEAKQKEKIIDKVNAKY